MKILLIFLFVISTASAHEFFIYNVCEKSYFLKNTTPNQESETVASLTLNQLREASIDFIGSELGISQMLTQQTGILDLEWIRHDHYFAYGWCYSVDGIEPAKLMNQVVLDFTKSQKIKWYFGHAEFKQGQWLTYCTPLYEEPRDFICKK